MSRPLAALLAVLALPTLLAASAKATSGDDVATLLKQADAYRLPATAMRVDTDVELYRNDVLDKERSYTVYLKSGRRSLILMKSPMEAGQKVLMLGDQFWLLMPESQRPLRITPSQKLLGEASTGDIANMTWSEDYDGSVVAEVDCPTPPTGLSEEPPTTKPRRCLHLDIAAARSGVTYSRIDLYLEKSNRLPVKADLFVGSGKQAKEAWYIAKRQDGQLRIMAMALIDHIQVNRRTLVRYRSLTAKEAPDEFFNPAALVRNSLSGW
jgi:hypothetical protein